MKAMDGRGEVQCASVFRTIARLGCVVQKHRVTIRRGRGDRMYVCMYVSSLSCQRLFSSPMRGHEKKEVE